MKKVLIMGLTPPMEGGSQTHVYEISSRIPNSVVLTQKNSKCRNKIEIPTIKNNLLLANISFFLSSLVYSIFLIFTLNKKYETIHIHENLLYVLAPLLRIRYKIIITVHGITGFRFYKNKFLWFLFGNSLKFTNKIISVDLVEKELLEGKLKNVTYIPNGVDLKIYDKIKKIKIGKNSFLTEEYAVFARKYLSRKTRKGRKRLLAPSKTRKVWQKGVYGKNVF